MKHDLKIYPKYYRRVADGSKTFEVRNNDRDFQAGDTVELHEFVPRKPTDPEYHIGVFTDTPALAFRIGYVLPIDAERVAFSLLPIEQILKPSEDGDK